MSALDIRHAVCTTYTVYTFYYIMLCLLDKVLHKKGLYQKTYRLALSTIHRPVWKMRFLCVFEKAFSTWQRLLVRTQRSVKQLNQIHWKVVNLFTRLRSKKLIQNIKVRRLFSKSRPCCSAKAQQFLSEIAPFLSAIFMQSLLKNSYLKILPKNGKHLENKEKTRGQTQNSKKQVKLRLTTTSRAKQH